MDMPIVTEWSFDDNKLKATTVSNRRVYIEDLPSLANMPPYWFSAVNKLREHEASKDSDEEEKKALEEQVIYD